MNSNQKTITSRAFTVATVDGTFVITEVAPVEHSTMIGAFSAKAPYGHHTRDAAWTAAKRQALPVVAVLADGSARDLGVVFDPDAFEQAAYQGYVSYGFSMTDGYYAPSTFDSFVYGLRRDPAGTVKWDNEFRPAPGALEAYTATLAAPLVALG
jgi:hypothetical protein